MSLTINLCFKTYSHTFDFEVLIKVARWRYSRFNAVRIQLSIFSFKNVEKDE